ncbi:phosphoglucosamine mutase [Acidobacteria bacterium AH-259-A15]|nr:phosphoglucosamine mutase [Acidobacteria bacterium AH-259-A15]
MKLLKISTAGVRGIVGQGMSAEVAMGFAQAFATYLEGGSIAVARDSRPSGIMMRCAVVGGLLACGSKVIDLGTVPSPTLQIYLEKLRIDGAIIIAAGHNPQEWNALKFLRGDGMYLNTFQGQDLLEIYNHAEFAKAGWDEMAAVEFDHQALDYHLRRIKETFDVGAIQKRHFRVAVDCCNGTCTRITPRLLKELECEVVALNDDIQRPFPHYPNPTPDNMSQLEALVRAAKADIGFAHDAEGERLGIVTERGISLHQEKTLAIACLVALSTDRLPPEEGATRIVVTNLSTSSMIDVLAQKAGAMVYRTPIGQAHVADKARQLSAVVAGEGCGQVILRQLHPVPDGPAVIVCILEHLARWGGTISELVEQLPRFHMVKENIPLPPEVLYSRLQYFRGQAEREEDSFELDLTDGVKINTPDGWVHVRVSTTESLLRIIAEANEKQRAHQLHQWARERVSV